MPTPASGASAIQAPAWLARLLTPFIARVVAREMARKHPGLGAVEIADKLRADLPPAFDPDQARLFVDAVLERLAEKGAPVLPGEKPMSAWALIAANLLPLYCVLFWNWEVFPLLALFWMENVIIGALNAARMLAVDPRDAALWAGKLFLVPFFCFHFGMFTAIHGVFVFLLFGNSKPSGLWMLEPALRAVEEWQLWLPLGALAASHLFSFFWNYLYRGEFRRTSLTGQMAKPYGRVVVLHLTILVGGFAAMALGSPVWALVVLIAIKVALDLRAHLREHRV